MNHLESPLVVCMIYSALLILLKGLAIGLSRFWFVGTKQMSYQTLTPGAPQGPRWYASLNRAYINSVESFALFAPAVLLLVLGGGATPELALTLGWVYLIARVLYDIVYIGTGYSIFVSFIWVAAFASTTVLWLLALFGR